MKTLDTQAREAALQDLPAWQYDSARDCITRQYKFPDFNAAFAFMTRVAPEAERINHHPEWTNVYNRIDVVLRTHDADGLTARDINLAKVMDSLEKPG